MISFLFPKHCCHFLACLEKTNAFAAKLDLGHKKKGFAGAVTHFPTWRIQICTSNNIRCDVSSTTDPGAFDPCKAVILRPHARAHEIWKKRYRLPTAWNAVLAYLEAKNFAGIPTHTLCFRKHTSRRDVCGMVENHTCS